MTDGEVDTFLAEQRVCRVATIGTTGPHATPPWYCWHERSLWLYSLTRSQRWFDLTADPRISAVVDDGVAYSELRGVELSGAVTPVGEQPRRGEPVPELDGVEAAFATRYTSGSTMTHDGRHAWLRLTPTKIVSWDFRKMARASRRNATRTPR